MNQDINEAFDKLQDKYLSTRSDKVLFDLYKLIRNYMAGFLKAYAKEKNFFLSDFEGKVEDCTYFIIEQYIRKPDWKIERFTAYYHNAIVKILHSEKQKQYDEMQKNIQKITVDENNLYLISTDIDYQLKIMQEIESPLCMDEGVVDVRRNWKQGELFEGEDL